MLANVYIRKRKRAHMINMIMGHLPCFLLAVAQSILLIVLNLLE
jgi:hypothetical protein